MKISQFEKESYIDYPNKTPASVVFVGTCNYRCPSCHAGHLLDGNVYDESEIFDYLNSRKSWIEGVVLCGGEPTTQPDLVDFAGRLKQMDLSVKLDTNGSNPDVLNELLAKRLIDYVAMDIKGPPELYNQLVGREIDLVNSIEKSAGIVTKFPGYHFRTTAVPVERKSGDFEWFNKREAKNMALWIEHFSGLNGFSNSKWIIQKFVARDKNQMIKFSRDYLPEHMHETPLRNLEEIKEGVKAYFPNTEMK